MNKTIQTAFSALLLATSVNLASYLLWAPGNSCLAVEQVEEWPRIFIAWLMLTKYPV